MFAVTANDPRIGQPLVCGSLWVEQQFGKTIDGRQRRADLMTDVCKKRRSESIRRLGGFFGALELFAPSARCVSIRDNLLMLRSTISPSIKVTEKSYRARQALSGYQPCRVPVINTHQSIAGTTTHAGISRLAMEREVG